jgi:hypothetical protein
MRQTIVEIRGVQEVYRQMTGQRDQQSMRAMITDIRAHLTLMQNAITEQDKLSILHSIDGIEATTMKMRIRMEDL